MSITAKFLEELEIAITNAVNREGDEAEERGEWFTKESRENYTEDVIRRCIEKITENIM